MRSEKDWDKLIDKMEEELIQLKIMTNKFEKAIDLLQVYCECENRQHQYCIKGKCTCGDCEKEIKQKTNE